MRRVGFWAAATVAVLVVEAAILWVARPAGARLRPYVDLVAAEGILLALGGALVMVERPFLAARTLWRRAERDGEEPISRGPDRRQRRRAGGWVLLLGAALFGLASLIWAIGGEPGT